MKKVQGKVLWVMPDDKIIKVENTVYDIDDKVYEYLKGKNLLDTLENKSVDVEIDETKGQTGFITRLVILDTTEKKETEVKKEEPKKSEKVVESGLVTKEITVGGVAVDKAGVVDKETKIWYTLDSTINAQEFKDKCTKKTIEVTIAPQEKGNAVIKSYTLKAEEVKQPEEQEKSEPKINNNDAFYRIKELERQVRFLENQKTESFEAQNAVNGANIVVAQMKEILLDPQAVLRTITKIAEHNFKTIQDLKNKG